MKHHAAIAIIGATGLVGGKLLAYLQAKNFPAQRLHLLASAASKGKKIVYGDQQLSVTALEEFDFKQSRLAFFAAGSMVAQDYAPRAVACGNWVIDKSSYFRLQDPVPLIIPSLNFNSIDVSKPQILAVPNCSTIPLAIVLEVIAKHYGLKRVEVATYQAVSGAGSAGQSELIQQLQAYQTGEKPLAKHFTAPILNNVLASIDALTDSGYTKEELKLQQESRKLLHLPELIVNATAVRVPVMQGHCAAVSVQSEQAIDLATLKNDLQATPHIHYCQMPELPNPLEYAVKEEAVWLGRLRQMPGDEKNRVNFWLVSNNLARGAALTAIEIAQALGFI